MPLKKERLRIAVTVDPEIPVPPVLYGGIERIADMLIRGLVEEGHEVTLFAHRESQVPCTLIEWKGTASNSYFSTVQNTATLLNHYLRNRYDIIHSFSRLAYLIPLLPAAVVKIMSYQREPSLQQIYKATQISRRGSLQFTGCSDYITNQINKVAKAQTIYNCVPLEKYDATESVSEDAPLIFLGRIEPIKGTHLAVEVAKKTGRRLIIAGNIPETSRSYFAENVQPFLGDAISYIGPVNDYQKNVLLGQAAALLMPIQWNEPFGIVMVEAMACGTPVLGFPYGAIPEVIENGVDGFICADVEEMIQKIKCLKTINRTKVRAATERKFSSYPIIRNYLNLYHKMLL